jgi:hypothetical protein
VSRKGTAASSRNTFLFRSLWTIGSRPERCTLLDRQRLAFACCYPSWRCYSPTPNLSIRQFREKTARRAPCGMVRKTTHRLVTTFYTYLHPTPKYLGVRHVPSPAPPHVPLPRRPAKLPGCPSQFLSPVVVSEVLHVYKVRKSRLSA